MMTLIDSPEVRAEHKVTWDPPTVVVASGFFNPIHKGHIEYLQEAKKLGDYLIVIVNTDMQVGLKGSVPFMNEKERLFIVEQIKGVDEVVLAIDKDKTVRATLAMLRPDIFAKGGDRTIDNVPEKEVCDLLGIRMVFNVGGEKTQSSSNLIKEAVSRGYNIKPVSTTDRPQNNENTPISA